MATPTSNDVPVSNVAFPVDGQTASLVFGIKWGGAVGTGVTLTYSFPAGLDTAYDPDSYPPDDPLFNEWTFGDGWTPLDGTQQANFIDALDAWANVADITFVALDDNATEVGEIRVAFSELVDHEGAGAWAYLPDPFPYAGDIWINHLFIPETFDEGSWYFNTLVHELGHALGLKHPFDMDGSEVVLPEEFDNIFYTVMTYTDDPTGQGLFPDRYPTTPMLIDILSIQYLYGANDSFHDGDDTYTFDGAGLYFETIWDAGGHDTIVHDGTSAAVIDLRPGGWSGLGLPVVFSTFDDDPIYTDPRTVWVAHDTWIEDAVGGSGDDVIYGNDLDNALYGGAGDDILYGGAGNDVLDGGDGVDTVDYRDATAAVSAFLTWTGPQFPGGDGTDILTSIENLVGSGYSDNFIGNDGANELFGRGGADFLTGGAGDDRLHGDAGNDSVTPGTGNDVASGGSGTDTLSFHDIGHGITLDVSLTGPQDTGGAGIKTISGFEWFFTTPFNDVFRGSVNSDFVSGLAGDDISYGDDGDDTMFGGTGNDVLYGGEGDDQVNGDDGSDVLWGGDGDDQLNSNWSTTETDIDTLIGGAGNDFYVVLPGDVVVEAADGGRDTIFATFGITLPEHFEDLTVFGSYEAFGNAVGNNIDGGDFNEVLHGLGGNDHISGFVGDDVLYGDTGSDLLVGGAGNDVLWGGSGRDQLHDVSGNDFLYGGKGSDSYDIKSAGSIAWEDPDGGKDDWINAYLNFTLPDNFETLQLIGDNLVGVGNKGNNVMIGSGINLEMWGKAGNDSISGKSGSDELRGNGGNDALLGKGGDDLLIGNGGNDSIFGHKGNDVILGRAGTDRLYGRDGNDVLSGGGGRDVLHGDDGADILAGGKGADVLSGGKGKDIFVLDETFTSRATDVISDFNNDVLHLDAGTFGALIALAGEALHPDNFLADQVGAARDANDFILFNTVTGVLYYDADGNGPDIAVKIATLYGEPDLNAGDIFIVT